VRDGITADEEIAVAHLRIAHEHFVSYLAAHGVKPARWPKLVDYLPGAKPAATAPSPPTFEEWAARLLAATTS
jgi:hypothetical protein